MSLKLLAKSALLSLLACCLMAVSAADADANERFVGKWAVDLDKMEELNKGKPAAGFVAYAREAKLSISMECKADGTVALVMASTERNDEKTGRWKVVKVDGDNMAVEMTLDGEDEVDVAEIKFLDDDLFVMAKAEEQLIFAWRRQE